MSQKNTKKKSTKKAPSNKLPKLFFIILTIAIFASAFSYFMLKDENSTQIEKTNNILETKEEQKNETRISEDTKVKEILDFKEKKINEYFDELIKPNEIHDKFEEYTEEFKKDILNTNIENNEDSQDDEKSINKENEQIAKEIAQRKEKIEQEKKVVEKKVEKKKESVKIDDNKIITKKDSFIYDKNNKPKLVIIIDDVSSKKQKEKILDIGYTVNMAFLPPTKIHKDSAKIAQDLPFYMIHFPMQASSAFKGAEENTLNINDSYETIDKRVKQLRQWYPNAVYTNNHTGSVFTENEQAVDKLFRALKKYNFIFVDSRTTPKSAIKKYAKKYNMPYIVRNTFIDNERDYNAIQKQLKKAIKIAKKQGYAIAIGHPHSITLKVLKESKHLLKDLDLVYLNQLPYL